MGTYTIDRSRERGASLVMALIILVLLTLVAVSALTVSNTQSRLAGNIQLQARATAEAESALSQAENWISIPANTLTLAKFGTVTGLYPTGAVNDPLTMSWTDANSIKTDAAGNQRYIIEVYAENRTIPGNSAAPCGYGMPGPCPNVHLFRITARGAAPGGAVRFVQSLFAVRTAS